MSRLRSLLDERARVLEQLHQVERQIELLRDEASDSARAAAERLRESPDDRSFTMTIGEFLRGAAEPPADVERDDFERCLGKVVLALRRRGEPLGATQVQVRYQPCSGRVIAIDLEGADGEGERQLYRRIDLGAPGAA